MIPEVEPDEIDARLTAVYDSLSQRFSDRPQPLFLRAMGSGGWKLRMNRSGFSMELSQSVIHVFHSHRGVWWPTTLQSSREDDRPRLLQMCEAALQRGEKGWYDAQDPNLPDELQD